MHGNKAFEHVVGRLHFGGMVQLQAAFGDACTGKAELGSCWFWCGHGVVDGQLLLSPSSGNMVL